MLSEAKHLISLFMESAPYQKLLNYSFWLLGRKNYTEAEILKKLKMRVFRPRRSAAKQKMRPKGATYLPDAENTSVSANNEVVIAEVLARLKELNYISDEKILKDYFEYRLKARPVGKFKFLHEMHGRGIPFERAKEEWEKRGVDETPIALEILEKKQRQWGKLPLVLRKKKAAQFLAGRGFAPDTVWGILGKM